jgi:3-deoxy-D-manno-octulosonic-acid transferase
LAPADQRLLRWYDRLWRAAIPLLKRHPRLATGYAQRCLKDGTPPLPRADLWWQAASAGEAYLVVALSAALGLRRPTRLLVTTQTRQGYDILTDHAAGLRRRGAPLALTVRYLPFDRPALMRRAVAQVRPRLAVLLETELWPGLMEALKVAGIPLAVVNARMGARSHRHYLLRASLWRALRPEAILALSSRDAGRFASLFGTRGVTTMPNIKFDRVDAAAARPSGELRALFADGRPLVVLGSVRSAEEPQIESLLVRLHRRHPGALLALFPRHMERLRHWQAALSRRELPWVVRSRARGRHPVLTGGGVLLWDSFGELGAAYALACGAYVGGSLVPLGGQNFLEPLALGIRPVIGPHWDNFAWVGREVVREGLVQEVKDTAEAFGALSMAIQTPADEEERAAVRAAFDAYLAPRRGGSAQAAALIRTYLA